MTQRALAFAHLIHARLGATGPPASPALLLAYAPIDVLVEDWPSELSGVLLLRSGRAVIGINARHSPARRHFTFWHEVGHFLLHAPHAVGGHVDCEAGRPTSAEREADAFAAAVLMPPEWVRRAHDQSQRRGQLARQFHVSEAAMARRLRELGLAGPGDIPSSDSP